MSLPRYPEYKDSGAPWIGNMPSSWNVIPLLAVARERRESNQGMKEDNLLSLSYGRIVQKDMTANDGLTAGVIRDVSDRQARGCRFSPD